jgi:hypothetical protein
MKSIIKPVSRTLLMEELNESRFLRETNRAGNEIYVVTAAECPNVMREIGRLREWAFRSAGGGTGQEVDIDAEDLAPDGYKQLVVWDPVAKEIVGGYRFIICESSEQKHLSTEHYFRFTDEFRRDYLPYAIELGRSYVHPNYQSTRANAKSLYVMDNIWDGLGAIIVNHPDKKYFFGKVTMYGHYNVEARNMLMYFLHKRFPAKEGLLEPIHPLEMNIDIESMERLFTGEDYAEDHKILLRELKERGEFVPPMISSYMSVSPSMMVFSTVINPDFGDVEETGIMITIPDMYPHKTDRHTRGIERGAKPFRKLFDNTMIAIDNVVTGRAASSVKVALRRRRTERTRRVERVENKAKKSKE